MKYMGIDVHQGKSVFCVVDDKETVVAEGKCSTQRATLTEALSKYVGARVLIEASSDSEWVARHLEAMKFEVIVGDPNHQPMYAFASKKVKTDKRDAHALALACCKGLYKPAQRMSDAQRRMRKSLDVRRTLVQMRTRLVTEVRSALRHAGCPVGSCEVEYFVAKVKELVLPREERELITAHLTMISTLEKQLKRVDKKITTQSKTDPKVQRLTTVPGVGPVTAAMFVAVVWDPRRFAHAHKLEAYLGLVPGESSSGEKQHRTGITKQGHPYLRSLLVQCAHSLLSHPNEESAGLVEWAVEIMKRSNRQVAVVALARKLAGLMFAMWRNETAYDVDRHATRATREFAEKRVA